MKDASKKGRIQAGHRTPAARENASQGQLQRFAKSEELLKMCAAQAQAQARPEVREKHRLSALRQFESAEAREKDRQAQLLRFSNPVEREKLRTAQNKPETRARRSASLKLTFATSEARKTKGKVSASIWATRSPEERSTIARKSAATRALKKKGGSCSEN